MATKNMNIGSVANATNVNVHLMGNLNYATCTTAAAAVAKVATVDASFPLTASCDLPEGFAIDILFSYANTATNPTLAISNGSATSKAYALKYEWGGPQIPSWASGDMVRLVLTSGGWLPEAALTPADETRNGIVTTVTQTFAGAKNVKNTVTASAYALSSVQGYGTAFPTAPVDGQIFFSLGGDELAKVKNTVQVYTYNDAAYYDNNAGPAIKKLRAATEEPFKMGSVIHIRRDASSGGFHTYFVGSTNYNYMVILAVDYYSGFLYLKYNNGTWTQQTPTLGTATTI